MIFVVLIIGLVLRLISLNQSLWLDEATSASTVKMSLSYFFTKFMPGDFHPPLYYLTLRSWSYIFGTSEIALRSLSVLFGVATIYVVYLIGKQIVLKLKIENCKLPEVAALLIATSGLHIYYSQEARMYTMSTFLVSLAIYFFIKIIHEKGRVGDWITFSLILSAIGLTDYLPLLILIPVWIFSVIAKKDFIWWKKFVLSHIILVIISLFWLPTFINQLRSGINVTNNSPAWVNVLGKFSIKDILLIPVKFAIGRIGFDNKFVYATVVVVCFSIFGYLIFRSVRFIKNSSLIYLWLGLPVAIALIISLKIPILNYFRFLFVIPAFYLIVASGIINLKKDWQKIALILILIINLVTTATYLFNPKFQREDWRSAVKYLSKTCPSLPGENTCAVVFPADSQMEAYRYYSPSAILYGPEALDPFHKEIWLVRYAQPISDPNDTTRLKVERFGYQKTNEYDFNGVVVWKYSKLNL